jgi:pimeloyl-ACP methyl ester carboxylesterase
VPSGSLEIATADPVTPTEKTVDGDISDWTGDISRYGGTAIYSHGELVYQDHIFDATGPDDGRDTQRRELTGPLAEAVPETYRFEPLFTYAPDELGAPTPEEFTYDKTYGDTDRNGNQSDLEEVRVASNGTALFLLARTTTMKAVDATALLVLLDTVAGGSARDVPFNSNLTTNEAEFALFLSSAAPQLADLTTGAVSTLPAGSVAVNPDGFTNAIEATVDLAAVGGDLRSVAVAAGNSAGAEFQNLPIETAANEQPHANVANVAFRLAEPPRIWMDQEQALTLHDQTIDPFLHDVSISDLSAGRTDSFSPGPGYLDRIFVSGGPVVNESAQNGLFQHYGVYIPQAYDGTTDVPAQWWLHFRGGDAHTGTYVVPRIFKHYGEDMDSIVISPSGRGSSTWYVGRGHVDVLQVWEDAMESFAINEDRVYVTGHSMGGWGSYLMTLLYPDRFAAAAPVAGPVTQGLWSGLDFPGCDDLPCWTGANDGRPRDQHTRKILENARHVPYAILQGTDDELVWYSGVARQAERLTELGYRHRFYTYPGYEHYSHPIADQWAETARYLQQFTRPRNPSRVSYIRDMPFERATEEVQSGGATLNFDFDSAYWMSELTVADGALQASFDGRSLAIPEEPYLVVPDSTVPTAGQTGPFVVTGLQWLDDPTTEVPSAQDAFEATLNGASAVRLDLARMDIDPGSASGTVSTDVPLELRLDGDWLGAVFVEVDGFQHPYAAGNDGVIAIELAPGSHEIQIVRTTPLKGRFQ